MAWILVEPTSSGRMDDSMTRSSCAELLELVEASTTSLVLLQLALCRRWLLQ